MMRGTLRQLEAVTSESDRIGNLGPALFAVIILGSIAILLCGFSSFIDKAGPRKTLRLVAFILIIVPTIYFSSVTYVSDSSQLAVNRKVDDTYKPRMGLWICMVLMVVLSIASHFTGDDSLILMHRQGHNVNTKTASNVR